MKRWILFVLSVALLYYVALIYHSRSMLFLVCVVLVLELCLQIYNLFLFSKLHVSIDTPITIIDRSGVIPVELTLSNYSFFPSGQVRVQLQAVYPIRKKKQSFKLCSVVPGRKRGESRSSIKLRFDLEPQYTGRMELSVRQAYALDLFGILPLLLRRKYVADQSFVMILPEKQEIPLELDNLVQQFSVNREMEIRIAGEKNPPEIAWIREYQPGDALRNIHWKLTAKQDTLMVREHISEQGCPLLFFIDLRQVSERYLQVFYSLGLELLGKKCSYYLVYYESDMRELVRTMISSEEDLYEYLLQTNLTGQKPFWIRKYRERLARYPWHVPEHRHRQHAKGGNRQEKSMLLPDWEEEYREKYRQISYVAKLVLRRDLVCIYNDEVIGEL